MKTALIVAWHNKKQIEKFSQEWDLNNLPNNVNLYLIEDKNKDGCGVTKNKGIKLARKDNCEYFIILDDDCYPYKMNLKKFIKGHIKELNKKIKFNMYEHVCIPYSRGTPRKTIQEKRVMLCMGFWEGVPDYWATADFNIKPKFIKKYIFNKYFSLSGMNISFREEVPFVFDKKERYDDIWGGWTAQKWIYANGGCCSTFAPVIFHSKQSDRGLNKKIEANGKKENESKFRILN